VTAARIDGHDAMGDWSFTCHAAFQNISVDASERQGE
jgi:hypothetical protein